MVYYLARGEALPKSLMVTFLVMLFLESMIGAIYPIKLKEMSKKFKLFIFTIIPISGLLFESNATPLILSDTVALFSEWFKSLFEHAINNRIINTKYNLLMSPPFLI